MVSAADFPAHGELDRSGLMRIPLNAYVQAVASAAESLERPLALVGHSMGGFIIQKYPETADADLAILLASVPPKGASGMVKRMATRRPLDFLRTMTTSEATNSEERTHEYFFSPATPAPIVNEVHRRLQPESRRVLRDMMTALHSERVKTPVVVMGAAYDWLVAPASELLATVRAFHTTAQTLPGGHDMMLDFAWEQVSNAIDSALLRHMSPLSVGPIQSDVGAKRAARRGAEGEGIRKGAASAGNGSPAQPPLSNVLRQRQPAHSQVRLTGAPRVPVACLPPQPRLRRGLTGRPRQEAPGEAHQQTWRGWPGCHWQ